MHVAADALEWKDTVAKRQHTNPIRLRPALELPFAGICSTERDSGYGSVGYTLYFGTVGGTWLYDFQFDQLTGRKNIEVNPMMLGPRSTDIQLT